MTTTGTELGRLGGLLPRLPHLETLSVFGAVDWEHLVHPRLTRLALHVRWGAAEPLALLDPARLPALRGLQLASWQSHTALVNVRSRDPLEVASVLVHEATHAWLLHKRISHSKKSILRIERVCSEEELRFLERVLSDSNHGTAPAVARRFAARRERLAAILTLS